MPKDKDKSTAVEKTTASSASKAVVVKIQKEVTTQLASAEVMNALIATTFSNFSPIMVKQAVTEGMMRGFKFVDFLQKDVYAIKYGNGYSLVTSIDYSRKVGMRSGIVGKTKPVYTLDNDGAILTCEVTVKKRFTDGYVGDFTEEVFFSEYTTGLNQWKSRPRTMIAKVAEMHALRQACPEELGKAYVEEEFQKTEATGDVDVPTLSDEDKIIYTEKLESAKTLDELKSFYADLPVEAKRELRPIADLLKVKLTPNKKDEDNKL